MSVPSWLDGLLAAVNPPKEVKVNGHDVNAEWTAFLESGASNGSSDQDISVDPELLEISNAPSLLDFYPNAGPSRLRGMASDVGTTSDLGVGSSSQQNGAASLMSRLQRYDRVHDFKADARQLPVSSSFDSLASILASSRSNEDIQLELVELLGFEGEGLQLVEEILRHGVRQDVVAQLTTQAGRPTRSASPPKNGKQNGHTNKNGHSSYLPSARLTLTASKGKDKKQKMNMTDLLGTTEDIDRRIQDQLDRPKALFHEDGPRIVEEEILPHVYTSGAKSHVMLSQGGRFALPDGTIRQIGDTCEEVIIPPARPAPIKINEKPVKIADLPPIAKGCFPNYVTLNRMQSIVQPTAMNTNENLLICAPTGAGKTDVAIMSIIRVLAQHVDASSTSHPSGFNILRDTFKIIYVAPMKALAAEITRKFSKRLAWLGIKVRELTGDMQLTRQEINETQVIVTTPEKWDVVTRKPTGEGELASKVKLLIIDEVHLLNEDRGAVIETIVARTLRQVESSQSLIRIVGLSATLPNYVDVSDFLRVNRHQGLFFFDSSFRPVPLEQHFIGVAGKPRSMASMRNMDQVVFDKVSELVQDGHQVMVFVHARKETVKTAQKLFEMAKEEAMVSFFDTRDHPKFEFYRRDISTSRNKEMKELFENGFGIHHAGMLRSDRNMMEKMFEDQAIKVLCCTSTLAWGVNLPAHAVVIKGTQVYDSNKGAFSDLSVLDVLQIFGRAGRPGYETSGVGYICTTHDKLEHYLHNIMAQHPIESKFIPGMIDALNAEVSLGTIANVQEAIQWLGYTYLFVRMRREPFVYGMPHDEPKDDPQLGNKRNELITQAARHLSVAKMIRFDEISKALIISDLGRIAAKYYLKYQTVEVFSTLFHPRMKNADLFAMLAQATEFDQIQIRENEIQELTRILESDHCPMEVKGGTTNKHGKVNILLQAHISKVYIEDFALVSDAAYVAQNAARIIRALLEIALSRNWANNASLLIDLSKAIEQRMWPYEHPLAQITTIHRDTLYNLRQWADETEIVDLRSMPAKEIGDLIHMNEKHGLALRDAANAFPTVSMDFSLRPLTHDLLQISVHVEPEFNWNAKISGTTEPFYVWVQDEDGLNILQWRSVLLRPSTSGVDLEFVIPLDGDSIPNSLTLLSVSDRWLGSDNTKTIMLDQLTMPNQSSTHTQLLDIPYLNITALDDPSLQQTYGSFIKTMNSIQSQAFWSAYYMQNNLLLSAPVASGKSLIGEAAIWHAFRHNSDAVVMVLVPHRRAVMETAARIRSITPKAKGITVQAFNSTTDFSKFTTTKRFIGVFAPTYLLGLEDSVFHSYAKRLSLLLLEDLHLLDEQYELITARLLATLRPARTRVVGLTSSLNDAADLGAWLGVDPGSTYSFQPRDRGNTLLTSVKTFSQPHSATLLKLMVKPAYDLIKASPDSGTIVFVPSRNACRTVATDMVTQSGTEMDLSGFLTTPRENVEPLLSRLRDPALFEPLLHGIGFIVPGGSPADLALVLELFASGVIRALIVPREACWTLPVRAPSVVIMGCQYTLFTGDDSDRRVVNYSRTELVRMQGFAMPSAHHLSPGGRLWVMCQAEQAMIITRVLNDGLPLESNLPALLKRNHPVVPDESVLGVNRMLKYRPPPPISRPGMKRMTDPRKRDMMDMLNWTYLARRIRSNPTYYDVHKGTEADGMSRLVDEWFRTSGEEYAPTPSMESVSAFGPRSTSDSDSWSVSITPSMSASVARGRDYDVRTMADDDDDRMEELAGESEVDGEVRDVSRVGMSDGERLGTPAVPVE